MRSHPWILFHSSSSNFVWNRMRSDIPNWRGHPNRHAADSESNHIHRLCANYWSMVPQWRAKQSSWNDLFGRLLCCWVLINMLLPYQAEKMRTRRPAKEGQTGQWQSIMLFICNLYNTNLTAQTWPSRNPYQSRSHTPFFLLLFVRGYSSAILFLYN